MTLHEMRIAQKAALDTAEGIVRAAETGNRPMTDAENTLYGDNMTKFRSLGQTIKAREEQNTIFKAFGVTANNPGGLMDVGRPNPNANAVTRGQKQMSSDYTESFLAFVRSGGKHASSALGEGFDPLFGGFALPALPGLSAASYEGSNAAGGYAVSVPTEPNIVPLGIPDLGVRSIASVIATNTDIKIPRGTAFPTAGIKAEGDGTGTNIFTSSNSTFDQFTLSAFMLGVANPVSWELLQDVQTFQQFAITDLIRSVNILEESYFVTGTGTNQPQGLIGNVGTGTGAATAVESTGEYLLQSTFDVLGTLKSVYHPNAGFLMNRKTGAAIRKPRLSMPAIRSGWWARTALAIRPIATCQASACRRRVEIS